MSLRSRHCMVDSNSPSLAVCSLFDKCVMVHYIRRLYLIRTNWLNTKLWCYFDPVNQIWQLSTGLLGYWSGRSKLAAIARSAKFPLVFLSFEANSTKNCGQVLKLFVWSTASKYGLDRDEVGTLYMQMKSTDHEHSPSRSYCVRVLFGKSTVFTTIKQKYCGHS